MTIYENERVTVTSNPTNQAKVSLTDKFTGQSMAMNKEAFETMCREVAVKLNEKDSEHSS